MSNVLDFHIKRDHNQLDLRDRVNIHQGFGKLIDKSISWFRADDQSELVQIIRKILAIATAAFLVLTLAGIALLVQGVSTWNRLGALHQMKNLPGKEEHEINASFAALKAFQSQYPEMANEAMAKWINKYQLSSVKLNLSLEDFKQIGKYLYHLDLKGTNFTADEIQEIFGHCKNARTVLLSTENIQRIEDLPKNVQTLDVGGCANLKALKLRGYHNLKTIIEFPKNLEKIKLTDCNVLATLPALPKNLQRLNLGSLNSLRFIPSLPEKLAHLSLHSLSHPDLSIPVLPQALQKASIKSFEHLEVLPPLSQELQILEIENCPNLKRITGNIPPKVETFHLIDCPLLKNCPTITSDLLEFKWVNFTTGDISKLKLPKSLRKLHLESAVSPLKSLPPFPEALQSLYIGHFARLKEIPAFPSSVSDVEIEYCPAIEKISPLKEGIKKLTVTSCDSFGVLPPYIPETLEELEVSYCPIENLPLHLPETMRTLTIVDTKIKTVLKFPSKLEHLSLANNTLLENVPELPKFLKTFDISGCVILKVILSLPEKLKEFNCSGCLDLESIPPLPVTLKKFFCNSLKISKLPELLDTNIKVLEAKSLVNLETFPDIPATVELFDCQDCSHLVKLPTLPNSLIKLYANNLSIKSISQFPPNLKELYLADCSKLTKFPEHFPVTLTTLDIRNCPQLEDLPTLPYGIQRIYDSGSPKAKLTYAKLSPREIVFH